MVIDGHAPTSALALSSALSELGRGGTVSRACILYRTKRIDRDPRSILDIWRSSRELLNVQRDTALQRRREGRISNEALRQIERDLDLSGSSGSIRLGPRPRESRPRSSKKQEDLLNGQPTLSMWTEVNRGVWVSSARDRSAVVRKGRGILRPRCRDGLANTSPSLAGHIDGSSTCTVKLCRVQATIWPRARSLRASRQQ